MQCLHERNGRILKTIIKMIINNVFHYSVLIKLKIGLWKHKFNTKKIPDFYFENVE